MAKTCLENGCLTQPVFNKPGEIVRLYCKEHKLDGMINVKVKSNDEIIISNKGKYVNIIQLSDDNYFISLRTKLNWG